MKVVILGSGELFTNLISGCKETNCQVVGVLRADRVKIPLLDRLILDLFNPSKELTYIKSHKLYEIKAKSANSAEFKKEILKLNADLIIVGSWGEKLKKPTINLSKIATINVHPALLPKYRGPNPYLQAIKNMETQTGITFHLMDENYDTGAILLQKSVPILKTDTGKELRLKLAAIAKEGVKELLNKLDNEIIIPVKQDENKASYFHHIKEEDVMLDFSKSAEEISAHIRSLHPWTKCYFEYSNQFFIPNPYKLEIQDFENNLKLPPKTILVKDHKKRSLTILCGDNKILKMEGLKLYGIFKIFTTFYIKFFVTAAEKQNKQM